MTGERALNDRISEKLKCPFYKKILRTKRFIGIECESLCHEDYLGFSMTTVNRFNNYSDLKDYTELFCCDLWEKCPHYMAVMKGRYTK